MHALTYVTCTYATTTTATTTTTTTTTTHSHNYDCDHDHNHYYDSDHDYDYNHDRPGMISSCRWSFWPVLGLHPQPLSLIPARHNGTKAHKYELIVGRVHGWTYLEILTFSLRKAQRHNGTKALECPSLFKCNSTSSPQRAGTCFAIFVFWGARHRGTMAQRHKDSILWLAECMVGPTLKSLLIF